MRIVPLRPRTAAAFLFLALGVLGAGARGADIVLSFSGSGTVNGVSVADNDLVRVPPGGPATPFLDADALSFFLGDLDQDGADDAPNDIDALAIVPVAPGTPQIAGVYVSLLSDQGPFKDGDILRFDPVSGSAAVAYSEAFLAQALDVQDGNIDVDAIAFTADGSLLFSLAEDELLGPSSVVFEDGSVAILPFNMVKAGVAYSALELETAVQNALVSSVAVGDVKGIEVVGDDLWFTVQNPTANDASIFSTANGGTLVSGFTEAQLGFSGGVEADALALLEGEPFPAVTLVPKRPLSGAPTAVSLHGLTPGQPYVLMVATTVAPGAASLPLHGFGALALDLGDALFLAGLGNLPALMGVADAFGDSSFSGTAPGAPGTPIDLALQAFDLGSGRVSHPVNLEINQ